MRLVYVSSARAEINVKRGRRRVAIRIFRQTSVWNGGQDRLIRFHGLRHRPIGRGFDGSGARPQLIGAKAGGVVTLDPKALPQAWATVELIRTESA